MPRSWFIKAVTTRLYLDDEQSAWIEVKDKLTFKEREALTSAGLYAADKGDGMQVEMSYSQLKLARILTWVVDWSAIHPDSGKSIPFSQSAVEALDPDMAEAIITALDDFQARSSDDTGEAPPSPKTGGGSKSQS